MNITIEQPDDESIKSIENKIEYNVTLVEWEEEQVVMKFNFTNPLYVSSGQDADLLIIIITVPQIF